jgi:putative flavoprotein involved in K+ transport
MDTTSVVVVGAGPAGLAVSGCLTEAGVDHVILERHHVGHSWRRERWDTLRTLTPNWMNGLPRLPYRGPDPDGFMTAIEVADLVVTYAGSIAAPVVTGTAVAAMRTGRRGHVVEADTGRWAAGAIVLATGPGSPGSPLRPSSRGSVRSAPSTTATRRNWTATASDRRRVGVRCQIADEVARSGRHVTLAVGEHVRLPRTYRGQDILWWMQAMGVSSRRWDDDIDDLTRARQVPSPQLIGTPERRTLDLGTLRRAGVELVGRLVGVSGGRLQCAGSLANLVANADLKQARLLDQVDEFIAQAGIAASRPDRPQATDPPPSHRLSSRHVVDTGTATRAAIVTRRWTVVTRVLKFSYCVGSFARHSFRSSRSRALIAIRQPRSMWPPGEPPKGTGEAGYCMRDLPVRGLSSTATPELLVRGQRVPVDRRVRVIRF